jgi:hypothetical protein
LSVQGEVAGLAAAELQPVLAAAAVAMGRLLDGRAQSAKPSAAKQLVALLDELHRASARRGRGGLRAVRELTVKGSGT